VNTLVGESEILCLDLGLKLPPAAANAAAHPSMICFEIGMRDSPVAVKREFGFSPAHPAMLLALKSHFWGRV